MTGEPLSKRPDDTPVSPLVTGVGTIAHLQETFSKRLRAYYESTAPLLEVSLASRLTLPPQSCTSHGTAASRPVGVPESQLTTPATRSSPDARRPTDCSTSRKPTPTR